MRTFINQLFRLKSLNQTMAETHEPHHTLKKVLGPLELILFGVGVIIGAGIFTTVGTAAVGDLARPGAGPAIIISFIITAIACGFAALCYAEFASMVPVSGSAYTYSYSSFGELIAWIIGWDLVLEYCIGATAVSISWSGYFTGFLKSMNIVLPAWAVMDFRTGMTGFTAATQALSSGTALASLPLNLQAAYAAVNSAPHIFGLHILCNLPASLILLFLTGILVIGIKESSRFNMIIVILKFLVIGFFIFIGAKYINPGNWHPFAPNGFAGIKAAAAVLFFAYIGFDCVSTVAEETKNPKRDMPIGIIGSLVISTLIYILVAVVFTGIIPFPALKTALVTEKAEPLAYAFRYINQGWASVVVGIGAIIAQTAVLLVLLLGQSRIFFSMSRDGLLPKVFSKVHEKFKTPHITTITVGVTVAVIAGFVNIEEVVDLCNIGTLFAFCLVCFGVIILRVKEPSRPRGFKVPFSPVIPLLGVASCAFLMSALPAVTWLRFFIWMIIGLVIYFAYSFKHSLLHPKK